MYLPSWAVVADYVRRATVVTGLRIALSIVTFVVVTLGSFIGGTMLFMHASAIFPPIEGFPSTDPSGRGIIPAAGSEIGLFPSLFVGFIGSWLAYLWTIKKHRSVDLYLATPLFIILSVISSANYISIDIILTRDAQAFLNVLLAASGATVSIILFQALSGVSIFMVRALGSLLILFCLYAFVAVPVWYSISYLSWKFGAGSLDSLDATAKAIGAMSSILLVIGVQWKDGKISVQSWRQ
jgi:hypothetical protein